MSTSGRGRGRGRGRGSGIPTTAEQLAQLISHYVDTAINQHVTNQNLGHGRGLGATGGSTIGQTNDAQVNRCSYKTFQACHPRVFSGADGPLDVIRWIEKMESVMAISNCADNQKVKYATCSFQDEALSWWNSQRQTLGDTAAYGLSWEQLKEMMLKEYCPQTELQKLEAEFWNLTMEGAEIRAYTSRFNDLARLVPRMVTPEYARIERYIWGLAP
jgi:hypothetical protein